MMCSKNSRQLPRAARPGRLVGVKAQNSFAEQLRRALGARHARRHGLDDRGLARPRRAQNGHAPLERRSQRLQHLVDFCVALIGLGQAAAGRAGAEIVLESG